MLLKGYNKALITDREKCFLTSASSAADTALTVTSTDLVPAASSSDTWADNDYMIVGEIGQESTEIMQMAAAVTSATSLTIDRSGQAGGLRHSHPVGTPIYRVDYNRIEYSRSTTATGTKSVLTTIRVQPDDLFTRYEDTSNTTGYGFVRFNNETSGAFSSYSALVNYETGEEQSSRDPRTLWSIRKKVRLLLNEKSSDRLTDEMIDDSINDKQRDLAHQRLWTFYEGERSFSRVANQFSYDIPATVQVVHAVSVDTQPLIPVERARWDLMHFDSDNSTDDQAFFNIWNRDLRIANRPSSAATTTTLGAALTATATSATVADSSDFNRGDYYRFIIDDEVIYATASTSTTFTGLLRGQEGTTAAAHSNGATITERDIVYTTHEESADLIDITDRTNIPEPDILSYGTAVDLAPFVGKEDMIPTFNQKYESKMKELESKFLTKQTGHFGRIKTQEERMQDFRPGIINPNLNPTNLE